MSDLTLSQHFSPQQIAEAWGMSPQTVRELFAEEPGVIKYGSEGSRSRRRYKTLRIPKAVVDRVHTRLSGVSR